MKKINSIVVASFTFFALLKGYSNAALGTAYNTQTNQDPTRNGMHHAASRQFDEEQEILRRLCKKITDNTKGGRVRVSALTKELVTVEKIWAHYRAAECAFETYRTSDASINPFLHLECYKRITREHIESLKQLLQH